MADLRGMARADPSAHLATNTVGREKAAVPRIAQVHWSNLRSTVQEGQMTMVTSPVGAHFSETRGGWSGLVIR
jgi:hypothetical protein